MASVVPVGCGVGLAEAESLERPIDKSRLAHDVFLREVTPITGIPTVDGVVAKNGVAIVSDLQFVAAGPELAV